MSLWTYLKDTGRSVYRIARGRVRSFVEELKRWAAWSIGRGTPVQQMAGSTFLGFLAFGSSVITAGLTLVLVLFFAITFLWGAGRWVYGGARATI